MSFNSLIQSSASSNLLFIPSSIFFISVIISFISEWFFFMVSMYYLSAEVLIEIIYSHPKFIEHSHNHSVLNSVSDKLLAFILFSFFFFWIFSLSFHL